MKTFILFFFCANILVAQNKVNIRDTSFNIRSTAENILKEYPFAEIVKPIIPAEVKVLPNVVYASIDKRKLCIDIFSPKKESSKKIPFVLIIHGGGWRSGDKLMEWPTAIHLAKNGYIAGTIEYRLSGEAKYPAAIYDLKEAIRWIRKNSRKYNIDPNSIAVSGVSAGGELAAFLGATGNLAKFEGNGKTKNHPTNVQAVINIDGIVDFTHLAESGKDTNLAKPSAGRAWFGATYKENPSIWQEASPINYVDSKTPPIVFINSSQDRYHAGRDKMIEKLKMHSIYSEVHTISETPHTFWLFRPWFDKAMDYMIKFLNHVFEFN